MSAVLLDTNLVTALFQGDKTALKIISDATTVYLSVVVIGELEAGFQGGSRYRENLEVLERFIELRRIKTQTAERDLDAGLHLVSAEMLELGLDVTQLTQQAVARLLVLRSGQLVLQRVDLLFHLGQAGNPAQGVRQQRFVFVIRREMLPDMPDAGCALGDHLTGIRVGLPQNQPEECGFARSVGADNPDPFTRIHAETHLFQHALRTVPHTDFFKLNHSTSMIRIRAQPANVPCAL